MHEVHETFRIQARFGRADAAGGYDVRPIGDLRRHIQAEMATIADIAPTSSEALDRALAEFESRNSAQKKHWSGMTREQIGEASVRVAGGNPGDGAVVDAFYGTLSTQSHARSRMTQRLWERSEDGDSMFVRAVPEDKIGPQSIAIIACEGALAALRTRRKFDAPA